jgi:hypothetical protein
LVDGRQLTLPEYMSAVTETLLAMCEEGAIDESLAPEAQLMLPRIRDLARYAQEGSLDRCAVHLDWAAKLLYLLGRGRPFDDAATRLADHDFTNTNPRKGAFWRFWEEGVVDPLITMDEALESTRVPPAESRDWGRGRLVEKFVDSIFAVNWDYIGLYVDHSYFSPRLYVDFPKPDSLNRAAFDHVLRTAGDVQRLRDILRSSTAADSVR